MIFVSVLDSFLGTLLAMTLVFVLLVIYLFARVTYRSRKPAKSVNPAQSKQTESSPNAAERQEPLPFVVAEAALLSQRPEEWDTILSKLPRSYATFKCRKCQATRLVGVSDQGGSGSLWVTDPSFAARMCSRKLDVLCPSDYLKGTLIKTDDVEMLVTHLKK